MSNIADMIEQYILRRLAMQHNSEVELKRAEIADEIECAPSQISYVLSTRFTQERGFAVESRRGLGGFIRIARVPLENLIYRDIINKISEDTTFGEIRDFIRYLLQQRLIQNREAALVMQAATYAYDRLAPEARLEFVRSMFLTLANFS